MKKSYFLLIGILCITLFQGSLAFSTVKPNLEGLVFDSSLVVKAKIVEVRGEGEEREVVLEPVDYLKNLGPAITIFPEKLTFMYKQIGKDDPEKFSEMMNAGKEFVFLLKFRPESGATIDQFHLELTDSWFGIEEAGDKNLELIKTTILKQRVVR